MDDDETVRGICECTIGSVAASSGVFVPLDRPSRRTSSRCRSFSLSSCPRTRSSLSIPKGLVIPQPTPTTELNICASRSHLAKHYRRRNASTLELHESRSNRRVRSWDAIYNTSVEGLRGVPADFG
ncbi:hypothetical protein BV22DRAFT_742261 [Leucogyrophana mollusca]|uniref:Uncharacterized protein n=1 Tax=Leucogyrophana mollusca TaxID=85980 RepID=A0ACB8B8N8_9AGAM|nr:hypothetical protein BV22DRAFT_742261 [Leucogyrophana mollusca]